MQRQATQHYSQAKYADAYLFDGRAPQQPVRYFPSPAQAPVVLATLSYLRPTLERPYNTMFDPPDGEPRENCVYDAYQMRVTDARNITSPLSIDREGFALWDAPSAVANFLDEAAILNLYYKEVAELALAATGATRAYVFDHLVRKRESSESGRIALTMGRTGDGSKPGANGRIHNDYSEASGQKRLAMVLHAARQRDAIKRYSILNIWRSIKGPVLDTPLAVCDARSVDARDLVCAEVRYQTRTGEIYLLTHSNRHQWFYFSAMDRHEALVFKQYDSQVSGVARFTPHVAFDHPHTPPDAPLRESIEARCLVVYD